MKHFIRRIFLFLIFVFLGGLLIETALLSRQNEYSYKYSYLQKRKSDIECLILGASISNNNINAHYIRHSFNAGTSGRPLCYDYELAKRFIGDMPKLKSLVLTITASQLYRDYHYKVASVLNDDNRDATYRCMHYKYMGLPYDSDDFIYWSEILNSSYDYMGRFLVDNTSNKGCDSLGYVKLTGHLEDPNLKDWKQLRVFKDVDYNDPYLESAINKNINYIKDIAIICKNNGVRFILLQTPFHPAARQMVTAKDKKNLNQCLNEVLAENKDVEYYDFSNDTLFNDDKFYYNTTI